MGLIRFFQVRALRSGSKAAALNGGIFVWDVSTGMFVTKVVPKIPFTTMAVMPDEFSPVTSGSKRGPSTGTHIAVATDRGTVGLMDVRMRNRAARLSCQWSLGTRSAPCRSVTSLIAQSVGGWVAAGTIDGSVIMLDQRNGAVIRTWKSSKSDPVVKLFDINNYVMSVADKSALLWDTRARRISPLPW